MSEADTGFDNLKAPGQGASSTEGPVASPASASRLPLVLIAEDEAPIAEAIAMVVEDAGYMPLVAAHGRQALELARARHPALIITDLMMPYLTGADLIKAVRADASADGHRAPPIILISAAGPRRLNDTGADEVLRKPFDVADLEALLRRYLEPGADEPQTTH